MCDCADGWWGDTCTGACPGIDADTGAGSVCGGGGSCDASTGECSCDTCYRRSSADSGACVEEACPDCLHGGSCYCDTATGNQTCFCPGQRGGADCGSCLCAHGGTCNSITSECDCQPGFVGVLCATYHAPSPAPSREPSLFPTAVPTPPPTAEPSLSPAPSEAPSPAPSVTFAPSFAPSPRPSPYPDYLSCDEAEWLESPPETCTKAVELCLKVCV